MKLSALFFVSMLFIVGALASDSEPSSSIPHKMEDVSASSAKINVEEVNAMDPKKMDDASLNSTPHHDTLERETVEVKVHLDNVNIHHLHDDEAAFFEQAMRDAIGLTQEGNGGSQDSVSVGAILVENGHGAHKDDRRALRGASPNVRSLSSSSWFDIYAIIETSCRFCGDHRDDDDDYYRRKYRYYEDDDFGSMYRGRYSGRHLRSLGMAKGSSTPLEDTLCQLLRNGPIERFHSVKHCAFEVSEW